jgi:hypothetical protein
MGMNTRAAIPLLILTACQALAGCEAATPAVTGPCALLAQSEVKAVFAGAAPGQPDASRQNYGIAACEWPTQQGLFIAQLWKSEDTSAFDEARSLMLGFLDPMKSNADAHVRYETVAGVGQQAVAVVETKDVQRGIMNDIALLVTLNGDQTLVLLAPPQFARRDRAAALASLKSLAKGAASRL